MMVHKSPSIDLTELGVSDAVETFEQESFDEELFYDEEDDKDDGEGEGGVWGELGEGCEGDVADVFVSQGVDDLGGRVGGHYAGWWGGSRSMRLEFSDFHTEIRTRGRQGTEEKIASERITALMKMNMFCHVEER